MKTIDRQEFILSNALTISMITMFVFLCQCFRRARLISCCPPTGGAGSNVCDMCPVTVDVSLLQEAAAGRVRPLSSNCSCCPPAGGGGRNVCDICGSSYKHRESLYHHKKKHQGLTTCPICAKVCSIVADLRRHMEVSHNLSGEQVRRIIPTKPKDRISWGELISRAGGNGQGRCPSMAREVQSPGPESTTTATDVTEAQNVDMP